MRILYMYMRSWDIYGLIAAVYNIGSLRELYALCNYGVRFFFPPLCGVK